jgi:hypothetical protein
VAEVIKGGWSMFINCKYIVSISLPVFACIWLNSVAFTLNAVINTMANRGGGGEPR